jgi:hypothetical protein
MARGLFGPLQATLAAAIRGRGGQGQPVIQRPDITRRLQAGLQIKGRTASPQLGDVVQPVVLVDDFAHPSWFAQSVDREAWTWMSVAPVALNFSSVQIQNPINSGVMVFVHGVYIVTSGDTFVVGRVTGSLQATIGTTDWKDRRIGAIQTPAVISRSGAGFAVSQIAFNIFRITGGAGEMLPRPWPLDLVLTPGEAVGVERITVNTQLDAGFYWTERTI